MRDQKFWAKVSRGPKCWEYTGALHAEGYGWVNRGGKGTRAHRWAWQLRRGPIPDGLWVLHKCDNRKCVRLSHLFLGTHKDNMADMARKGRQRSPFGEAHKSSKLSAREVMEIRAAYKKNTPGSGLRVLGMKFGVTPQNIRSIVTGRTWVR